jgi:hypothetical protein
MTAGTNSLSLHEDRASDGTTEIESRHEELYEELRDLGLLGSDLGLSYLYATIYGDQVSYCAAEGCWVQSGAFDPSGRGIAPTRPRACSSRCCAT